MKSPEHLPTQVATSPGKTKSIQTDMSTTTTKTPTTSDSLIVTDNDNENDKKKNKNKKNNIKKQVASEREYGGSNDDLIYKSGIPTLRSSAHRVKFDVKRRKHDPKPKDRHGQETHTTWLPDPLLEEDVFSYDTAKYNLAGAIANMLQNDCDSDIVGTFEKDNQNNNSNENSSSLLRLEDFRVPVPSIWRSVNGGNCENAQKYLSDQVAGNENFLNLFDTFVQQVILPYLKRRLLKSTSTTTGQDSNTIIITDEDNDHPITFYYQRPPTLRLQPGPGWAKVKPHNDAEYGHQNGEINFWVPLTDRTLNGVDLWCEKNVEGEYHAIPAPLGSVVAFHGSSRKHYVNANGTCHTRVSLDFRIGVQGYFDPYWQMKGTTHDHGRKEVTL